jgi:hypothetical protein
MPKHTYAESSAGRHYMPDLTKLPHDTRAAIIRARLAPTMAEAARIYCDALRSAGVAVPVIA